MSKTLSKIESSSSGGSESATSTPSEDIQQRNVVPDWRYDADRVNEPTRPKIKFPRRQQQPYDAFMSKRLSRPDRENPYIEEVNALIDESPNKSRNKGYDRQLNQPISPIFQFNTFDHEPTSTSLKYNQQAPGQRENRYYRDGDRTLSQNRRQYVHYIKRAEDEEHPGTEDESAEWVKNYISYKHYNDGRNRPERLHYADEWPTQERRNVTPEPSRGKFLDRINHEVKEAQNRFQSEKYASNYKSIGEMASSDLCEKCQRCANCGSPKAKSSRLVSSISPRDHRHDQRAQTQHQTHIHQPHHSRTVSTLSPPKADPTKPKYENSYLLPSNKVLTYKPPLAQTQSRQKINI